VHIILYLKRRFIKKNPNYDDKVDVTLFVNTTEGTVKMIVDTILVGGTNTTTVQKNLGYLRGGSQIYLGIGPSGPISKDNCKVSMTISSTDVPTVIGTLQDSVEQLQGAVGLIEGSGTISFPTNFSSFDYYYNLQDTDPTVMTNLRPFEYVTSSTARCVQPGNTCGDSNRANSFASKNALGTMRPGKYNIHTIASYKAPASAYYYFTDVTVQQTFVDTNYFGKQENSVDVIAYVRNTDGSIDIVYQGSAIGNIPISLEKKDIGFLEKGARIYFALGPGPGNTYVDGCKVMFSIHYDDTSKMVKLLQDSMAAVSCTFPDEHSKFKFFYNAGLLSDTDSFMALPFAEDKYTQSVNGDAVTVFTNGTVVPGNSTHALLAIIAYDVTKTDLYSLTRTEFSPSTAMSSAWQLRIHVFVTLPDGTSVHHIDRDVSYSDHSSIQSEPLYFDIILGELPVGSKIYVAAQGPPEDAIFLAFTVQSGASGALAPRLPNAKYGLPEASPLQRTISKVLSSVAVAFPSDWSSFDKLYNLKNTDPKSGSNLRLFEWQTDTAASCAMDRTTCIMDDGTSRQYHVILQNGQIHPATGNMYSLLRYTIPVSALYSIKDLTTHQTNPAVSGTENMVDVLIFVNNTDGTIKTVANYDVKNGIEVMRQQDLGYLYAGSQVYVGIGPNGSSAQDRTSVQFTIYRGIVPYEVLAMPPGSTT